ALFGKTAKEWRNENSDAKGNIRDVANIQQLIVLSNLESMNAELIKQNIPQKQRLIILNNMAIDQMTSIIGNVSIKKLS
ncbi:MAG TPA: KilA-N domain-containing protein, partial [bacterium]|nr:KilA-N domain-containing protein [bacterium]